MSEIVLHNFAVPPKGPNPSGGLIRDSAGNLYGTGNGGTVGGGIVFKLDAAGHQTVLHNFTGGADGLYPAGLIRDSSGNLYGTTYQGGAVNAGVVYKLDPAGHETVLYNFTGGTDGGSPYAGVIRDSAGNLYGTTYQGGTANAGVVYKPDAAGHETVLYSFTGGADGNHPSSGLIRDSSGNLYGTTSAGGNFSAFPGGCGVVFKIDASGHETVLYYFGAVPDGRGPSGLTRDSSGNLYGTTSAGGNTSICWEGCGVVFKLDTSGHETVLYAFTGLADGGYPTTGIIRDSAGNLYGTTSYGGSANGGVVYKLEPGGHETVLYNFTGGADGGSPYGVIRDSAGNLYGITQSGGAAIIGVVYELDAAGHQTVLYSFPGPADGDFPYAGVIRDSAGNLYGNTYSGGAANRGLVYKVDATGHETVLYTFTGGADGGYLSTSLISDSAGNLYGTAGGGGDLTCNPPYGCGVLYKLDTAGHETVLHNFTVDFGFSQVIRDSAGNFYGAALSGGTSGHGAVYKLDTAGQVTVLYNFTGGADGSQPTGVIRDSAGNLYGTTEFGGNVSCGNPPYGCGVVYKLDTAGHEKVLYSFKGGIDGATPGAGVIRDAAGNFYGTTFLGGTADAGVVYKLDMAGHETILYSFTGGADGRTPGPAVLIRDSSGNLYGTTEVGGTANAGVVYKLDPSGQETVLYSFTGGSDGGTPLAGVIRDSAGNLYGTASGGGKRAGGVVFKLVP
jgi:uncharacterized repeat protein (TIGR03803 family)